MEVLHCPDNLKVHFAGYENFAKILVGTVNYVLFSYFQFDQEKNGKLLSELMDHLPRFKHVIQDSGLYSMLFGKNCKKAYEETDVINYYERYVTFCENHNHGQTIVEIDCQNIVSPEFAWELRRDLRNRVRNRIINVFHFSDGKQGLEKLVEFSDYIALSVPEFRKRDKVSAIPIVARRIKKMKPEIDIHLLGCTQLNLLRECKFCTSSDSTSWCEVLWYGTGGMKFLHERFFETEIRGAFDNEPYFSTEKEKTNSNRRLAMLSARKCKDKYQKIVGSQD